MSHPWREPAPPAVKLKDQPEVQSILEAARILARLLESTLTDDGLLEVINDLLFDRYNYWRALREGVLMLDETVSVIVDRLFYRVLPPQTLSTILDAPSWGDLPPSDCEKIVMLVESALVANPRGVSK